MGLFDSIKNAFGKGETGADDTASPSQALREAGLDPAGLDFLFSSGTITVSGAVPDERSRAGVVKVLSALPGIAAVEDRMTVAPAKPAPAGSADRSYTVVPGDTLWKISEREYGNGADYAKIFEANSDVLESPDRILPGQVLKIPR